MTSLLRIAGGSAIYGFAIGSVHSPKLATWNLAKFPLLIVITALVCGLAYYAFALVVSRRLTLGDVTAMSLRTFADISVLLASLAPVAYFLATTIDHPTEESLREYPFFLGLNVAFIAFCGSVALLRQATRLSRERDLALRQAIAILTAWLAISLFVGGQCAWFMRPFFEVSTNPAPMFMEGTRPDFRGATSFYEAVWQLVDPPVCTGPCSDALRSGTAAAHSSRRD